MRIVDLIVKKRDGGRHSDEEIRSLVLGYTRGAFPDYQMSAWLMAVVWRGLDEGETLAMTRAMVESGDTLDLSSAPGFHLDKHSTGGVGDKTTLAVIPILAAGGIIVAKMSGRGLGHTGGTLDKLEAIPGFRTQLSSEEILEQVRRIGACVCAQSSRLVPADQKLYALRDATGTVPSLPLIASSIMSKKIASGAQAIVLDIKVGAGAFMKTLDDARLLAQTMVRIGERYGVRVAALLTDMEAPLGFNVGNGVEVREAAALLRDHPQSEPRLRYLVLTLAAAGFVLAGQAGSLDEGRLIAEEHVRTGRAYAKLREIVTAQGGDPDVLEYAVKQPAARVRLDVRTPRSGYVTGIDAEAIGIAAMQLGAGRSVKEDPVDPTAGVVLRRCLGANVTQDTVIATLYTESELTARQVAPMVESAFRMADQEPQPAPLIYEVIGLTADN